ncbi:preprotein translocase subunit SecE [Candidatus Schmidhempelia bombi]|jgi:preprotein translocase subunit SecE|uniref:Protein translocase subunit SecE n=1 Tax=Candidatus Schmidhempelia bombi str. Bimp TaxID=1387197 RepID=A0AB94ICE4_9GAMM|nr:preprotein translocase subunit SecE [Candidatus Schmidhempelia bombi]TEA27087.1 preprotein translocase subunit SecE [Candidatus Schmidhempelia bombi str. Bimp]
MRANIEHQEKETGLDKLKWLVVLALFIIVVWGNFYFAEPNAIYQANTIVRVVVVGILAVLALILAATTSKGKQILVFAQESRQELRKVVWPTRRETIQTTLLIAMVTLVSSLFLWGLDNITIRIISFLTLY